MSKDTLNSLSQPYPQLIGAGFGENEGMTFGMADTKVELLISVPYIMIRINSKLVNELAIQYPFIIMKPT